MMSHYWLNPTKDIWCYWNWPFKSLNQNFDLVWLDLFFYHKLSYLEKSKNIFSHFKLYWKTRPNKKKYVKKESFFYLFLKPFSYNKIIKDMFSRQKSSNLQQAKSLKISFSKISDVWGILTWYCLTADFRIFISRQNEEVQPRTYSESLYRWNFSQFWMKPWTLFERHTWLVLWKKFF